LADPLNDATLADRGDDEREDEAMAVPQTLAAPRISEANERSTAHERPFSEGEASLAPGTRVEVRKRLDGEWARGFEVISASADGYRLRRLSDGGELPLLFSDDDVRKEKKRGTWWY
jgi:hypothetical protein